MPTIPLRTVEHVYVLEPVDGKQRRVRLNYNIVSLVLSNGVRYFVEPAAQAVIPRLGTDADIADNIRIYSQGHPHPGTNFGQF